jgi:leucyl aminopeptidase (aminopeptidase T)
MDKLYKAAQVALNNCLAVKKGETVLVITDEPERKVGYAFWEAAREIGTEAMLLEILPRSSNGEEPPEAVARLMRGFDVLIIPTSKSMSHTGARREACEAGARCVTLPGILEDTAVRTLNADYNEIAERSTRLAELVNAGQTARVTTPAGTDVTMTIQGRECHADTGLVHNPGEFSNLPAGEAYVAPVEGSAGGVIVVDGAMVGKVKQPIRIVVKDGYATQITGGKSAEELEAIIEPFGQPGRNVAELGIGTNHKAQIVGSVLEDEKVMGTVHMALGDNKSMGGNVSVQSHLDGILLKPTLWIDDKKIMENGVLKI